MAELGILFVCVGNSCRSPMAEAIARKLGGGRVEAQSVGLAPAGWIAGRTLTTLDDLGYPTDGLSSKGLDAVSSDEVDVVVSLLGEEAHDVVPVVTGARHEAWPTLDPFGEDEEVYLGVARQLEARIRRFLEQELHEELSASP
jgi:arsenate reductase